MHSLINSSVFMILVPLYNAEQITVLFMCSSKFCALHIHVSL